MQILWREGRKRNNYARLAAIFRSKIFNYRRKKIRNHYNMNCCSCESIFFCSSHEPDRSSFAHIFEHCSAQKSAQFVELAVSETNRENENKKTLRKGRWQPAFRLVSSLCGHIERQTEKQLYSYTHVMPESQVLSLFLLFLSLLLCLARFVAMLIALISSQTYSCKYF